MFLVNFFKKTSIVLATGLSFSGTLALAQTIAPGAVKPLAAYRANPAQYFGVSVPTDLVLAAGFTKVSALPPQTGRLQPPVYYFRAAETASDASGWAGAADLVTVLVRTKINKNWQYNGGQLQLIDLGGGRTQARLTSSGYYIVVTGSDPEKVATLAHNLKVLY